MENAIITHTRYHRTVNDEPLQAFTLIDMQTAFFILSFGLFGSWCVFIGELYTNRNCRRDYKRNNAAIRAQAATFGGSNIRTKRTIDKSCRPFRVQVYDKNIHILY